MTINIKNLWTFGIRHTTLCTQNLHRSNEISVSIEYVFSANNLRGTFERLHKNKREKMVRDLPHSAAHTQTTRVKSKHIVCSVAEEPASDTANDEQTSVNWKKKSLSSLPVSQKSSSSSTWQRRHIAIHDTTSFTSTDVTIFKFNGYSGSVPSTDITFLLLQFFYANRRKPHSTALAHTPYYVRYSPSAMLASDVNERIFVEKSTQFCHRTSEKRSI